MIGNRTRVRVVKNKVAPPFKQAEFDIIYGEGISKEGCILDLAVDLDIINKSGSWYSCGDIRLGQGRENAKQFLKENSKITVEVENKVRQEFGMENSDSQTSESSNTKDAQEDS